MAGPEIAQANFITILEIILRLRAGLGGAVVAIGATVTAGTIAATS